MAKPKPLMIHVKALLAALTPLVFALGFSWCLPVTFLSFRRVEPTRVEGQVDQRLLGVISFKKVRVRDLRTVDFRVEEGGRSGSRNERGLDDHYIDLIDANGDVVTVESTSDGADLVERIRTFLADPSASALDEWTVYSFGLLAWIPALVGLLFTAMVLWDLCACQWARLTFHPESRVEQNPALSDDGDEPS